MSTEAEPQQVATTTSRRERALYTITGLLLVLSLGSSLVSSVGSMVQPDEDWIAQCDLVSGTRHGKLQEYTKRIKSELTALRTQQSHKTSFERELTEKLEELEAVVEGATSLGFFKRGRTAEGQIVAQGESAASEKQEEGALASLLSDPRLSKQSSRRRNEAAKDAAVGGAEVPCDDTLCAFGATKENISLEPSASRPKSMEAVVEKLSDEQRALQARLAYAVSVMKILPLGSPVDGEVSSDFGYRRSPFSRRASFHEGLDLSLSRGGHVAATGAGIVRSVAYNSTYGIVVDIEHTADLVTRYAHLTKALVHQGQKVTRGDVIALSGSTGRSTGPHLHYEVLFRDRPKNPRPFLDLANDIGTSLFERAG